MGECYMSEAFRSEDEVSKWAGSPDYDYIESIRGPHLDVFTVSPKRQYRGFALPTTEATTAPEWNPALM